jgi:hypothetical protein
MGYYTQYQLTQVKNNVDFNEVLEKINKISEDYHEFDESGTTMDACKWYDHTEHLEKLSSLYPHTVFRLHGEGEETGDIWEKYFHQGKLFHTEKLKTDLPVPDLSKY